MQYNMNIRKNAATKAKPHQAGIVEENITLKANVATITEAFNLIKDRLQIGDHFTITTLVDTGTVNRNFYPETYQKTVLGGKVEKVPYKHELRVNLTHRDGDYLGRDTVPTYMAM